MQLNTALIVRIFSVSSLFGLQLDFLLHIGDIGDTADTRYNMMINELVIQIHAQVITVQEVDDSAKKEQ